MRLACRMAMSFAAAAVLATLGCNAPASMEAVPDSLVMDGLGHEEKIEVNVYNKDGQPITEDLKFVWFSSDTAIIKLDQTGTVRGIASGEAAVEVELVGTDLKAKIPVRIKNPSSSQQKTRKLMLQKQSAT